MRGVMIGAGAALVSKFQWILYLFGLFLIYTGFKMFFKKSDDFDPHDSFVIKLLKKFVHVSKKVDMHNFFVKENGKSGITTLFVALIIIEISDVVFAFDSIPAIFAITTDPFIVFTSNIFAILGLRSLYFVIAKFNDIFHYLNVGLAIVLIFIGIKMLIEPFLHISIIFSLLFIALVIGSSMAASLIYKKHAAVK
jgi:tellurite resistance protein TerC